MFDKIDKHDWRGIVAICLIALAGVALFLREISVVMFILTAILGVVVSALFKKESGENGR